MKHVKIQSHASLRKEMIAVARGEKSAPKDAGGISFESVEALLRLLTPQNRKLLAVIRDKKPQSIAELAELTGRASPNLTRTLGKLEAVGFVRLESVDRRKIPTAAVHSLQIKIDPFSQNDRLEMA
ncbi:MAG: MarR family transcriptional regulator [Betaproteobacteria bacterium]|nr:MarR family transcriptional regulator [Betaproteobacteria bacterium]